MGKRPSYAAICRELHLPKATLMSWFGRDPDFKDEVEKRKTERKPAAEVAPSATDPGDFLSFRKRFWGRESFYFHADAYRKLEAHDRLVLLLPPEHGKTTTFSIEYVTWKLIQNPDLRVAIIQKSEGEARKVVGAIQQRLSDHRWYLEEMGIERDQNPITLYGPFKPERQSSKAWGADHFMMLTRRSAEKDYSVQAKGFMTSILSQRVDLMILDDVQEDLQNTPDFLDKFETRLQHSLITRLGAKGKLVVLGSRIGPGDIYEYLEDNYCDEDVMAQARWEMVKYPAVINDRKKEGLCPDLWPWDALMRRKAEVKDQWWTNWMMQPTTPEGQAFKLDKLNEARDFSTAIGYVPKGFQTVIGVDPAISGFTAIAAWAANPEDGRRHLVDIFNEQNMTNFDNVAAVALEMARRHSAKYLVVELRNTQGDLYDRLRRQGTALGIRVIAYKTATATGAQAQETDFSISSVGALFDEGLVSLPYGDVETRAKIDPYITQLNSWRPKPSNRSSWHLIRDMVMATLFAESEAREIVKRGAEPIPQPKRRAGKWVDERYTRWNDETKRRQKDMAARPGT